MRTLSSATNPRPPLHIRRGAERGFTLAEMFAVMAMIGVLAVVASPVFINMVRDRRVSRAAMQVADMYRTARTRALAKGVPVRIHWDVNAVYTYMRFDVGDGRHERAVLTFNDDKGVSNPVADVCFTPRGRAFLRTTGTYAPLNGVPTFSVVNSGTGKARTVFIPPNGDARFAP